jgi:putative tryptophan/tyrosine transport system substrate-binding protein
MRRREFIGLAGAIGAAWPFAVRAQPKAIPVIGFLSGQSPQTFAHLVTAFKSGLAETGYVEDQNFRIEYRWAEGRTELLPSLASELVRLQVAVIVAVGGAHAAGKAATSTIPIVFTTPGEPVQEGLASSLNRPGGNATGISVLSTALEGKRMELLCELVPGAKTIGVLFDPGFWTANLTLPELQDASAKLGKSLRLMEAPSDDALDTVLASMNRANMDVLAVTAGPFTNNRRDKIAESATRAGIPAIFEAREAVRAGALISYGASIPDVYRWVGIYTGRILGGEKPADLPILQPTQFELAINQKTAKALGLKVPPTLLARADEVIE